MPYPPWSGEEYKGGNVHILKTWPGYFQLVFSGVKKFELRKNDRDFKVGDLLILMEFYPDAQSYSGREVRVVVTGVFRLSDFNDVVGISVRENVVLLSIKFFGEQS